MIEIRQLDADQGARHIPALAAVLIDCVEGNASVSFMLPLSQAVAEDFFVAALLDVAAGKRILLAAFQEADLVGTVQIVFATAPNQPHRADVAKLLVARAARGQGVAAELMRQVEVAARAACKSLLVLDTVTGGGAERLYSRLGWARTGEIPGYALFPDGNLCATTIFWKQLA